MQYKHYYLIERGTETDLVLAETTRQAIELYFASEDEKRIKDERRLPFDPSELKIKQLQREDFLIKAP